MRRAQLPWYDFSFLEEEHAHFWASVRDFLRAEGMAGVPDSLDSTTNLDGVLTSPDLLLSQTCGYDIGVGHPELAVVATPVYSAPGCGHGTYSSFLVVRDDSPLCSLRDARGARFVANDDRSWSGYHCLRDFLPRFREVHFSGGHSRSLGWIANGDADIAAIDCVVWELLRRHRPGMLAPFRVIGRTEEAYAPPIVTRASATEAELVSLRRALREAIRTTHNREVCTRILLQDFVDLREDAYASMAKCSQLLVAAAN